MRLITLVCYFASHLLFSSIINAQSSKLHPDLIDAFEYSTNVEAILVFDQQLKLQPEDTRFLPTKEEKGAFVFHQLDQQARQSHAEAILILDRQKVRYHRLSIVNAIAATLTKEQAHELQELSSLKSILPSPWVQQDLGFLSQTQSALKSAIEWGVAQIKAPELWALGFTGQGVVVGGQDTGYEYTHPTIFNKYRGNVDRENNHDYNWHDAIHSISPLNSDDNNPCGLDIGYPCDDNNHGTHTMGTMVGDDEAGNQIGVAPGATWVACRNMERGWGSPASYLECFEWFLAPTRIDGSEPDPSKAPHVIANSWSCPEQEGCLPETFELFNIAINNLRAAGVVVVTSAGNDGPDCGSISKPPSVFPNAFSVGATNIADTIARFSSRGPSSFNGLTYLQPQVVAPGVNIRSAIRNEGFANLNGTSMAGPHVAGAVAVLISALPELSGNVMAIENILRASALPLYTNQECGDFKGDETPNAVYGHGRIDLESAYTLGQEIVSNNQVFELKQSNFNMAPNPATSKLFISVNDGDLPISAYSILDLTGRELYKSPVINTQNVSIDLDYLPSGLYIVSVTTQDGSLGIKKFIKQ